jgi:hypothetical protein
MGTNRNETVGRICAAGVAGRPASLKGKRKCVTARRNCVASLRLGGGTMAHVLNQRHVDIAFFSGRLLQHGKPVEFQCLEIGQLLVTSGTLAASRVGAMGTIPLSLDSPPRVARAR